MRWSLRNWFTGRKKSVHRDIIMYTRQGCHLCEQAWELLEHARRRYGFALRQVDIDGDPQLVSQYGECVPVVTVDGRVRFRGRINKVLLKRLLDAGSVESS